MLKQTLLKQIGCSLPTLNLYLCRFPNVFIVTTPKGKSVVGLTDDNILEMKKMLEKRTRKKPKKLTKSQMEKLYYKQNEKGIYPAQCFDFNFSYDANHNNTCYSNYDTPCKCLLLLGKECKFIEKQLGVNDV